jgi:hypothetical protein
MGVMALTVQLAKLAIRFEGVNRRAISQNLVSLGQMIESCLYKTAHYNYRNKTRPYPLIRQVMNGTGAIWQFVPKVARHSSRAAFGYWPVPVS